MRRRIIMLACLAAGVAMSTGCDKGIKTSDADIAVLEIEQMEEMLTAKGETAVVDVRIASRYEAGHIPGAINIPLPDLRRGDPRIAYARRIVVYAGGWTDPLSAAGAKRMLALGYKDVYEFKGGMEVWTDMGRPVSQSTGGVEGRADTDR